MRRLVFFLWCLLAFVSTSQATTLWTANGVDLQVDGQSVNIVADDSGGAIVLINNANSIYLQKINNAGVIQWGSGGVSVGLAAYAERMAMVHDGSGGAFVVYQNQADSAYYLQRVQANGSLTFSTPGIWLEQTVSYGTITGDNAGNVIIFLYMYPKLYARKYNTAGTEIWDVGGVTVTSKASLSGTNIYNAGVDGSGNVYVGWNTYNLEHDIYAQKLNSSGVKQWGFDGIGVCVAPGDQKYPQIVPDNSGGALLVWTEDRSGNKIFSRQVQSNGVPVWEWAGVTVCAYTVDVDLQTAPANSGNMLVAWNDLRSGKGDAYAQIINNNNTFQWTTNGLAIGTGPADKRDTCGVYSGTTSFIAWQDGSAVHYQGVKDNGALVWANDLAISTNIDFSPKITHDGSGGAIVVWKDASLGLAAQRIAVPTATATPTQTPTCTQTPIINVRICEVEPNTSLPGRQINTTLLGQNFAAPAGVILRRAAQPDVSATGVSVAGLNKITCQFNLPALDPGYWDIQVNQSNSYGFKHNAFLILDGIEPPLGWQVSVLGQAGTSPSGERWRGLAVGDGDNDHMAEIYVAGLSNYLYQAKFIGTAWSVVGLAAGAASEYYTDVEVSDANQDGTIAVYGATLDHHVYEFAGAVKTDISGDMGQPMYSLATGDANQDDRVELYAACRDGCIYQFKEDGGWSQTVVGIGAKAMVCVAVGDGDNDGAFEVYGGNEDYKTYQYKYNGTGWTQSTVAATSGEVQTVVVGDADNDGRTEVYTASQDGRIYQSKWTSGFFWETKIVNTVTAQALLITDADMDGNNELYVASENGYIYQLSAQAGVWSRSVLGQTASPVRELAVGDVDQDYQLELVGVGEDSRLYQIKARTLPTTPTPTITPVSNFNGKVICKQHVYAAPNPARGQYANIVIVTAQAAEVSGKLFTTGNQEVLSFRRYYSGSGKQVERIFVNNLANGVYVLLVRARGADGTEERVIRKIAIIK